MKATFGVLLIERRSEHFTHFEHFGGCFLIHQSDIEPTEALKSYYNKTDIKLLRQTPKDLIGIRKRCERE